MDGSVVKPISADWCPEISVTVEVTPWDPEGCLGCEGSGRIPVFASHQTEECPECEGTGDARCFRCPATAARRVKVSPGGYALFCCASSACTRDALTMAIERTWWASHG